MESIEKVEQEGLWTGAERDENIELMPTKLEPLQAKPDPSVETCKAPNTKHDDLGQISDANKLVENIVREQSDLTREQTHAAGEEPKDLINDVSTAQREQGGKGPIHGGINDADDLSLTNMHDTPQPDDSDCFDWLMDLESFPGFEVSTANSSDRQTGIVNELKEYIQRFHDDHDILTPGRFPMNTLDDLGDVHHPTDDNTDVDTTLEPTAAQGLSITDNDTEEAGASCNDDTEKTGKKRAHTSDMTTNGEAKKPKVAQKDEM